MINAANSLVALTLAASSAMAATQMVTVGASGLAYSPDTVTAAAGDTVM